MDKKPTRGELILAHALAIQKHNARDRTNNKPLDKGRKNTVRRLDDDSTKFDRTQSEKTEQEPISREQAKKEGSTR